MEKTLNQVKKKKWTKEISHETFHSNALVIMTFVCRKTLFTGARFVEAHMSYWNRVISAKNVILSKLISTGIRFLRSINNQPNLIKAIFFYVNIKHRYHLMMWKKKQHSAQMFHCSKVRTEILMSLHHAPHFSMAFVSWHLKFAIHSD